jgi:hypothetical protein
MKFLLSLGVTLLLLNPTFAADKPAAAGKPTAAKGANKADPKKKKMVELDPSISFKPDNMLLEVAPGTTLNEKILVKNNEDLEFQAQIIVVPVFTNEAGNILRAEQTKEVKGKRKGKTMAGIKPLPFLDPQIQEKVITVKAKQVTSVPIAFKVPADAKGSYYFQYSVQPLSTELQKIRQNKIKKSGKTGAMMGINVTVFSVGAITVKDKSAINMISSNQIKYLPQVKQLMIQSKLTNKGNDYVRRYSGLAVVSKGGTVVAQFNLKNTQDIAMLVPGATQLFAGAVEAALPKGDYEVVITYKDHKGSKLSTFKESLKVN